MKPEHTPLAFSAAALGLSFLVALAPPDPPSPSPEPCATSYAILARDPLTGRYGVAAASHAPLIGMNLDFIDPDAGGVVVLGGPYLTLNEKILIALRDGLAPGRAIAVGLAADEDKESRQVLALSPGGAAAFTGDELQEYAGHRTGDYFVAAGHRLTSERVITAMSDAFADSDGPLGNRLLLALQAGQAAGGEDGGEHSAALLVVGPGAKFATRDRLVDLRIDYVPQNAVAALVELKARIDSVYGVIK